MSSSSIPNLLSLRGSRGRGGRGRIPGRGGASSSSSPSSSSSAHDTTIQGTDTDAAVSRMSAVDLGYLDDPYARFFVQAVDGPPPRRLPIINRGTYARTKALDLLIDAFISGDKLGGDGTTSSRQIISLGAGTDTRPFRLFSEQSRQPTRPALIYHEIDFALICQKKLRTVQMNPLLSTILTQATPVQEDTSSTSWSAHPSSSISDNSDEYYCHGIDLRQLTTSSPSTSLPGLRTDIPTLLLSECCLCYLTPQQSSNVLSFFTSRCTTDMALAIYEPIHPDDPFGRQMVANLAARNIRMPTLEVYGTGAAQEARLKDAGLEAVRYMTVEDVWERWIAMEEKERVDGLEGLDEVEEWKLLAGHYVVVWGARGEGLRVWVDSAPS